MKTVPVYPKILSLGSAFTENALAGSVVVQEKVDGSQLGWGLNEDGDLVFRSKGQNALVEPDALFRPAVEHLKNSRYFERDFCRPDTYFYGETVTKPKHNVVKYGRAPAGYVVLFDGICGGRWLDRNKLVYAAGLMGTDVVPERYRGPADLTTLKGLLEVQSFLDGATQEGLVIKNYGQTIFLGGQPFPLFTKLVRTEFKEAHAREWGNQAKGKSSVQELGEAYRSEARWRKAVQHLREAGVLLFAPQDISALFRAVNEDIEEECAEDIKAQLYRLFRKEIVKEATRGLPEWWKQQLVEQIAERLVTV